MSYCLTAHTHPLHQKHHDLEHGFPAEDEEVLFERLVMEMNQPGLSWLTVLKKRENFYEAFSGYSLKRISEYGDKEIESLLANSGIIRHRQKIEAVIFNAKKIISFGGGFSQWLQKRHPLPLEEWVKQFRKEFKFTGPSVVSEFLMSVGYLPGAHQPDCPIYKAVLKRKPHWLEA